MLDYIYFDLLATIPADVALSRFQWYIDWHKCNAEISLIKKAEGKNVFYEVHTFSFRSDSLIHYFGMGSMHQELPEWCIKNKIAFDYPKL
jgi:hypothetical protein